MAEGRSRDQWEHTSSLIYAVVTAQNPKAARKLSPATFNPWRKANGRGRGTPLTVGVLLAMRGMVERGTR
jgi:hypothetical protein